MAWAMFGSAMTPLGVICEVVTTGFTEPFAEMTPLGTIGDNAGDRNFTVLAGAFLVICLLAAILLAVFPVVAVHLNVTSTGTTGSALGSRDDAIAEAAVSSAAERKTAD